MLKQIAAFSFQYLVPFLHQELQISKENSISKHYINITIRYIKENSLDKAVEDLGPMPSKIPQI